MTQEDKVRTYRYWLMALVAILLVVSMIVSACSTPEPETVVETVRETVVVEVEKEAEANLALWHLEPMEETTTVVLSVESGAQEKTLGSFHDQLMEQLNIDLQVVAHPFSEQYEIQYLDLSSGAGQYDVLSFWPIYFGDFWQFLTPLGEIHPGGEEAAYDAIQFDDVHPAYQWCYLFNGTLYATQYDGDVKLLHFRRDLADDPANHEAFQAEYGYDYDMFDLTWDQYLDVGEFFMDPENDFYGTSEIAGFLAGWYFKDRLVGMGGHMFDYDMNPFAPSIDVCYEAMQNGIDTFDNISPPEAHSFEFEDARNQIIVHDRVFMHTMWPDGWKWANDPSLASPNAVCNVSVAMMPGFEQDGEVVHRPEMNGGRVLAVNGASQVKEAALKVLAFFSDKYRTSSLVGNNDTWLDPWRITHMQPELYAHLCRGCEWNCDNYVEIIEQSTANGYPGLQIAGVGRYYEVQERWTKKAFAGQATAQEACDGMAEEYNAITEEIGRDKVVAEYRAYVDNVLKPLGLWP
jgi:multiple sugar transport system substrate-binding protein